MAGAIWGAANGDDELGSDKIRIENSEKIIELAKQLHALSI